MLIGNLVHETELVSVRDLAENAAGVLGDDHRFAGARVSDLQSVRLAGGPEHEQRQRVIVDPMVIADGLHILENQRRRAARQWKLPKPLGSVFLNSDDGNVFAVRHQGRRILAFGSIGHLCRLSVLQIVLIDVGLTISDRGVENPVTIRQKERLVVIAGVVGNLLRFAEFRFDFFGLLISAHRRRLPTFSEPKKITGYGSLNFGSTSLVFLFLWVPTSITKMSLAGGVAVGVGVGDCANVVAANAKAASTG